MAVTPADVKAFAPETASASDALVQVWIDAAATFAPGATFDVDADLATKLWVAHSLVATMGGASGAGGPVTSRRVGDVAVTYAAPGGAGAGGGFGGAVEYGRTTYGMLFVRLCRKHSKRFAV